MKKMDPLKVIMNSTVPSDPDLKIKYMKVFGYGDGQSGPHIVQLKYGRQPWGHRINLHLDCFNEAISTLPGICHYIKDRMVFWVDSKEESFISNVLSKYCTEQRCEIGKYWDCYYPATDDFQPPPIAAISFRIIGVNDGIYDGMNDKPCYMAMHAKRNVVRFRKIPDDGRSMTDDTPYLAVGAKYDSDLKIYKTTTALIKWTYYNGREYIELKSSKCGCGGNCGAMLTVRRHDAVTRFDTYFECLEFDANCNKKVQCMDIEEFADTIYKQFDKLKQGAANSGLHFNDSTIVISELQ